MSSKRLLKFIEPMKAEVTAPPPENGEWIYEVKFDGFRVLAVKNGKQVELWSRNHKPLNDRFPEIANAVRNLPTINCILDGEVCALDERGKSSFQLLQNAAETGYPVVYYIFDLLFKGTEDLRPKTLLERKNVLAPILRKAKAPLYPSAFFEEDVGRILQAMKAAGAEGSIAKLKNSTYESGKRSGSWVKIKFHRSQEFVIVGYTLPKSSRKYFGSLLLGYYREKRLVFAGRVGTGFNDRSLREIYQRLRKIEIPSSAVGDVKEPSSRWRPKGWKASDSRWVKPVLVGQVQFTKWTDEGVLRHPSFLGLREDKKARDVVRE